MASYRADNAMLSVLFAVLGERKGNLKYGKKQIRIKGKKAEA